MATRAERAGRAWELHVALMRQPESLSEPMALRFDVALFEETLQRPGHIRSASDATNHHSSAGQHPS